jgi:thymidine kinase
MTATADGIPFAGDRRSMPPNAHLKFFYGPMDCGKSTLALQMHHNQARQGRRGLVLTRHDRSAAPRITTRVGLSHEAIEVQDETDLRVLVRAHWARGERVDYLIVDEAGFLTTAHVDQLAELVDESHVDAYCFGLITDFRSELFEGARRLVELADEIAPVQVEVLCWCGRPGRLNARVVDERVVRDGDTVVVADTERGAPTRYQVLCRRHFRAGLLGPDSPAPGQLSLGA